MTIQHIVYVFDHVPAFGDRAVRGVDRLVLLSLANHANENDEAWPSCPTIGGEAGCHPNAARRSLRNLEALGYIESGGLAPDNRIPDNRRPNLYRLTLGAQIARSVDNTPPADSGRAIGRATGRAIGRAGCAPKQETRIMEPPDYARAEQRQAEARARSEQLAGINQGDDTT